MKSKTWGRGVLAAVTIGWLALSIGCDSGGGDGDSTPDVGANDINVVLCIGDSITEGRCRPAGAPYPSRLAGMAGKNAINAGICGEQSFETVQRAPTLLARHKPGYMCLLIGANDAIYGHSAQGVANNIRTIIQQAKSQQTLPIVATMLPAYDSHAYIDGKLKEISALVRQVAKEEGARLVDLEKEFGGDRSLIQPDGLHPSDSGNELIALSFNDRI